MKRLKAAFIFMLILFFVVIAGNHFIKTFNQTVFLQLDEIKSESNRENYECVIKKIKVLQQFYLDKKAILSLFVHREQLNSLAISLQCLDSYAAMQDEQNLINEAVKAKALVKIIDESVSRLF